MYCGVYTIQFKGPEVHIYLNVELQMYQHVLSAIADNNNTVAYVPRLWRRWITHVYLSPQCTSKEPKAK